MAIDIPESPVATLVPGLKNPTGNLGPGAVGPEGITGNNPITSGGVNATIRASQQNIAGLNINRYLTETTKYYMSLAIGDYGRQDIFTITPIVSTTDAIILPLPLKIVDHHGVTFDETPLGPFLGESAEAITTGMNKVNSVLKTNWTATDVLSAAAGAVGSGIVDVAIGAAGSAIPPGISNIASAIGYSPNQFLTILLRGPQYKRFDFSWNFSPRNIGESQRLNQILNRLHNAAAPSLSFTNILFKFPKIFQISFMPNSQYLVKFKPAALTDIITDYTGAGQPSFYRQMDSGSGLNAPTHVNVTLRFLELEFWLSGNWQNSTSPTDTHNTNAGDNTNILGGTLTS